MARSDEENFTLKSLAGRLRDKRINDTQFSQEQIGFLCGLSHAYISDIEKGKKDLRFLTLWRYSRIYGISMAELFDFTFWSKNNLFLKNGEKF